MSESELSAPTNFIRNIIKEDLDSGKHQKIISRFPPEPNGYLHIGHAKSICLNFGIAQDYSGLCNLRFDDTNPEKENQLYINAIKEDVSWLGFDWAELHHASDYFENLFTIAIKLVEKGVAYVDSMSADDIREYRGTLTQPGKDSIFRERPIEENLTLLNKMRAGDFKDGEHVLRAKIDMASPNMNLRDPIIYRIRHIEHHQTGNQWCVYPMYDFTHALSDAFEGITHSLCTLEFEDHRPLYDWVINHADIDAKPRQIEFGRLFLEYAITSKRKLNQLVEDKYVDGWDDPRMPTISGLRRRGYTPSSIREFCKLIGVSKSEGTIDMGVLESCIREDLNTSAPRAMAVLDPIKVTITNYPGDKTEILSASNHPQDESMGKRDVPFSKELYIERDDFMEEAPNKFFRLKPEGEVRLRNAYVIKCIDMVKNESGDVIELHCTYDPDTLGKKPEGRKVKGVIHWVSAPHAIDAEIRLYDRLFNVENPAATDDFTQHLNPGSLDIKPACKLEASLAKTIAPAYQFERLGYFCLDKQYSTAEKAVFNRTVTLRDSWAKGK